MRVNSWFLFILLYRTQLYLTDQDTLSLGASTGSISNAGSISVSKPPAAAAGSLGHHRHAGSSKSILGAIKPPLPLSELDPITSHSKEILAANGFSHARLSGIARRHQVLFLNDSNIRYSISNASEDTRTTSEHSRTCPETLTLWVPAVFGQYTISQHLVLNPFLQAPQLAVKELSQTSLTTKEDDELLSITKYDECHYQPRDKGLFATFAFNRALGSLKGTFELDELPGETIVITPLNKRSLTSIKTTNSFSPSQQKSSVAFSDIPIPETPSLSAHLLYIIKTGAHRTHDGEAHSKIVHLSHTKEDYEEDDGYDDHDHCGVYTGVEGGSTTKSQQRSSRHNKQYRHKSKLKLSKGNSIERKRRSLADAMRRSSGSLKWLELALILDTTLLRLLNTTSSRNNKDLALETALAITNLIDQVFQPLKIRVVLSYVEIWSEHNQVHIIPNDGGATLLNLMSYTADNLYTVPFDSLQLLLASQAGLFGQNQYGTASAGSVCSLKSVGVTTVGLDLLSAAIRVSHMIAHNLGISHDSSQHRDCICPADEGCLMRRFYRRLEETTRRRPVFSSCSQDDLLDTLQRGAGLCLLDSPFPLPKPDPASLLCGNGIVDPQEDCDCGGSVACLGRHSCCDPLTCRLVDGAQCSDGPCCTPQCKFKTAGTLCREESDDCDLPEYCTGTNAFCPADGFQRSGELCDGKTSYCFNRTCVGRDDQCQETWGPESKQAADECVEHHSADSDIGICGLVQCQAGASNPLPPELQSYSQSIIHVTVNPGKHFQCKTLQPSATLTWPDSAWTKDGSKCGHNRICLNQACIALQDLTTPAKCPTNKPSLFCSGYGQCNDLDECSCDTDHYGPDCSQLLARARPPGQQSRYFNSSTLDQENIEAWKKDVLAHNLNLQSSAMTTILDNFMMLIIMAGLIALLLLMFLVAMICYRVPSVPSQDQLDSPHAPSATNYDEGSTSNTDSPSASTSFASTAHLTRHHYSQRSRAFPRHPNRQSCRSGRKLAPPSQCHAIRPLPVCCNHGHANPHYISVSPEELPRPHFMLSPDTSPSTTHYHHRAHLASHHSSLKRDIKPYYGSTLSYHPPMGPSSRLSNVLQPNDNTERSSSLQELLRHLGNYPSTQSPPIPRESSISKTVRSVQSQTVGEVKVMPVDAAELDHMPPVMRELNITRMLSCEFHDVDTLPCYDTVSELEQVWKPRQEMRWRTPDMPWSCPPSRRPFLQLDQLISSPEPEKHANGYFSVGCQSRLSDEATNSSTDKSSSSPSCSHSV